MTLSVGEVGELCIRGPQVMVGYLNNPEATAQTIDADGWLSTGDLARIDADEHLFIVGRVKELIKVSGFQVAPAELEALLLAHPDVTDVAVCGVYDANLVEYPKAFVVIRPGTTVATEDIIDYVKERVATYKQIREVAFVEQILRRLLVSPGQDR